MKLRLKITSILDIKMNKGKGYGSSHVSKMLLKSRMIRAEYLSIGFDVFRYLRGVSRCPPHKKSSSLPHPVLHGRRRRVAAFAAVFRAPIPIRRLSRESGRSG